MKITVTKVDATSPHEAGFMRMTGFPIEFVSSIASGSAFFVPASGVAEGLLGQIFDVEIAHTAISDLHVLSNGYQHEISALPSIGSFRVCGIVSAVLPLSSSPEARMVEVVVGDARFTLDQNDLGGNLVAQGETIMFSVHEVSLWDEAI